VDAVLAAYRSEGHRLVTSARAADLVERALRGKEFTPQLHGAPGPGQQGQHDRLGQHDRQRQQERPERQERSERQERPGGPEQPTPGKQKARQPAPVKQQPVKQQQAVKQQQKQTAAAPAKQRRKQAVG
jgi:hypothetical protein